MTEPARRVAAPSGHPPPTEQVLPGGTPLDLKALAEAICDRYRDEFPDERERYGEVGVAWCRHDNQHILNWAVLALHGVADLDKELSWLARVLEARQFPLERLARNLELAGEVVQERAGLNEVGGLADRLREGAALIRSKPSFLAAPPELE